MSVEVIVDGLENNPHCFHGPCLLFRKNGVKTKEYYACSACRDRKECPFYLDASDKGIKKLKNITKWVAIREETIQNIFAKSPYRRYLKIIKLLKSQGACNRKITVKRGYDTSISCVKKGESITLKSKEKKRKVQEINAFVDDCIKSEPSKELDTSAAYCYSCDELLENKRIKNHNECKLIKNLTEYQLKHPTEILIPKDDSKTHAQYFFSKDTVRNIVLLLSRIHTERILCIGAPRIHEYLVNECKGQFESLLLDIDLKYYNFYSEKQFIWYNMFNNCVLKDTGYKTLEEFLHSEKITVVMDPPFGGRVEPLAFTLNALNRLYCHMNGFVGNEGGSTEKSLWTMWIFPYFMERHITSSLPNFKMFDLKIDYENHSSFTSVGSRKRKFGSPIRIFTNIPLPHLSLDGVDGYKFCAVCGYWVSVENRHCEECGSCTSKNGRTYIHCWKCSRCVKPSYRHCDVCGLCALPDHDCRSVKKSEELVCYHCKGPGHKKRDCPEAEGRKRRKKGRK